jgi:hypothetical protein
MSSSVPHPAHKRLTEPVGGGTALVVFESMFGSTRAAARAVAEGLRSRGMRVRVCDVASAPEHLGEPVDLLVLGAPTHAFTLSTPGSREAASQQGASPARVAIGMREWVGGMTWDSTPPDVAVFDTRVTSTRLLPFAAARTCRALAEQRGLRVSTRPMTFLVDDVHGPLLAGETKRALAWGRRLAGLSQLTRVIARHHPPTEAESSR